jgi:hypothetical protein
MRSPERRPHFLQGMIVSMKAHCASVESVVYVLIPVSKISSVWAVVHAICYLLRLSVASVSKG